MKRSFLCAAIAVAVALPTLAEAEEGIAKTFWQFMVKKNDRGAENYLKGLSKAQLVTACREMHDIIVAKHPKGKNLQGDMPRKAVIGMSIAGFVEAYTRQSLLAKEDVDPTPFHKMIVDDSLDPDFRCALIGMMGDNDFYYPSWAFIRQDIRLYSGILNEATLELETRLRAATTIGRFVRALYIGQYHKTPALSKIPLDPDLRKRIYPNVVRMLVDNPAQFSVKERARLTFLTDAATKESQDLVTLVQKNGTGRVTLVVRNILGSYIKLNLLTDPGLATKIRKKAGSQ